MNDPGARSLRNVAVIANRGAGKTSLAEAILFTTGAIPTATVRRGVLCVQATDTVAATFTVRNASPFSPPRSLFFCPSLPPPSLSIC